MATRVLLGVISAAVAFLIRFFVALWRERRGGACRIVHILRDPAEQNNTPWTAPICEMPKHQTAAVLPFGKHR